MRVPRYDYYSLRPAATMPNTGFLVCEGIAAKEGVLRYATPEGGMRRELVTKEDTLTPASLATLAFTKFTEEHPPEPVTLANTTKFGRGTVLDDIEFHNGFVKVRFVVDSDETIRAIREDGLEELSPGYEVELIEKSGVHPTYGPFDAIQGPRFYNHLAGTRQARGGHDIRFRTDSGQMPPGFAWQIREDNVWPTNDRSYELKTTPKEAKMPQVNLDGFSLDVPDIATAQAISKFRKDMEEENASVSGELAKAKEALAAHQALIDEKEAEIAELAKERDRLKGELDAVKGAPAPVGDEDDVPPPGDEELPTNDGGFPPKTDADKEPPMKTDSKFLDWHKERKELEPLAERYQVDSADDLQNGPLKRAIVAAAYPDMSLEGASEDRIDGIYAGLKVVLGRRDSSYQAVPRKDAGEGGSPAPRPSHLPNRHTPRVPGPPDRQSREDSAQSGYLARLTGAAD